MLALVGATGARAGDWIQVSCQNPNGSTAPSDGWSISSSGSTFGTGNASADCSSTSSMFAELVNGKAVQPNTSEELVYAPPTGSALAGGEVQVTLDGDGHNTSGASGIAALYEPAFVADANDQFYECAYWNNPNCVSTVSSNPSASPDYYSGPVALPADRGGDLTLSAWCDAIPNSGLTCNEGGARGYIAHVTLSRAELLLSNSTAPDASGFSGSALQGSVTGTGHVVFTAGDPSGPGVYRVTVRIGGRVAWSATPSTNSGRCVPVGSLGAVLLFDWQQPCPQTEVVDAPVPTRGLSDGHHELSLRVTDAAGNSSTVLDQTIKTSNPGVTPVPRGRRSVHAHFELYSRWNGSLTRLYKVVIVGLPRTGRIAIRCTGRACPRLSFRLVRSSHGERLLAGLSGRRFTAGDRLYLTVSAPGRTAERIVVLIRNGRKPTARLL
jgi:hypothetical protein